MVDDPGSSVFSHLRPFEQFAVGAHLLEGRHVDEVGE